MMYCGHFSALDDLSDSRATSMWIFLLIKTNLTLVKQSYPRVNIVRSWSELVFRILHVLSKMKKSAHKIQLMTLLVMNQVQYPVCQQLCLSSIMQLCNGRFESCFSCSGDLSQECPAPKI